MSPFFDSKIVAYRLNSRQVEEIAQVPGIDVLFVGPWDLGNNIGRPVLTAEFHPDLEVAIERIRKAATDNGKKAGIYCPSGEFAKKYIDQGFNMVRPVLYPSICLDHDVSSCSLCSPCVIGLCHFRCHRTSYLPQPDPESSKGGVDELNTDS